MLTEGTFKKPKIENQGNQSPEPKNRRSDILPQRTGRTKTPIALLFLLVSVLVLLVWGLRSLANQQLPPLGRPLPPYLLSSLEGSRFSLDRYQGTRYLLLFFSVECPHCRNELSNVALLYPKYKTVLGFFVVSVSDRLNLKEFSDSQRYPFPMFHFEGTGTEKNGGAMSVPTLLLVDEKGILRARHLGDRSLVEDERILYTFLNEGGTHESASH